MPFTYEDHLTYWQRWYADRRAAWFAGRTCVRCGSDTDLELDHVDSSTKVSSTVWGWSQDRRDAELAKCQVLCRPCHLLKTVEAGDTPWGEANGKAKLTEAQVRDIKARQASGERQADLAREYGVSRPTISNIIRGKRWRRLDGVH